MHPSRKVFLLISMTINLSKESPAALYKVVVACKAHCSSVLQTWREPPNHRWPSIKLELNNVVTKLDFSIKQERRRRLRKRHLKWIRATSILIALIPIRVGKFFWTWILKDRVKLEEKQKKLFTSSAKREIRHFHVLVVQRRQKKCTKKRGVRAKLLFCQSKPISFFRSRCRCSSSVRPLFKYVNHIFRFQALATEGRNVWTFAMIFENGWSPPHAYRRMYIY